MLFLGCDGGSSKYAYVLCDASGHVRAARRYAGLNIIDVGMDAFTQAVRKQMAQVLAIAGARAEDITAAAFCMSGYGESKTSAQDMHGAVHAALGHTRFIVANDSVAAWSGALQCAPGIVVASGTGSVAYGEDGNGGAARAGGWSIHYGDEGSAYWVAVQAINSFFRQADGRAPRTMLYDAFMARFDVADPLHMPMALQDVLRAEVARVADFQREVLALYDAGDPCVRDIYVRAAQELAQLAAALMSRLHFTDEVCVSYTGGLFKAGACVVGPFTRAVEALGARATAPLYGPAAGAVGYAARTHVPPEALERMLAAAEHAAF